MTRDTAGGPRKAARKQAAQNGRAGTTAPLQRPLRPRAISSRATSLEAVSPAELGSFRGDQERSNHGTAADVDWFSTPWFKVPGIRFLWGEAQPELHAGSSELFRALPELFSPLPQVLSGYLGSPEQGGHVLSVVRHVKSENAKAFYVCDPVMGHPDKGCVVAPGVQVAPERKRREKLREQRFPILAFLPSTLRRPFTQTRRRALPTSSVPTCSNWAS